MSIGPESGGQWTKRQGAIAEVRVIMRGVGHGYNFSVLNDIGVSDDLRYFERPQMVKLKMTNLLGPEWSNREKK
jgi:hypothetical protein